MIKALLALAAACTLVWVLNTPHGKLPPFGKLLSPYRGFWQNGERPEDFPAQQTLAIAGLQQPVTVRYDDRRVPHIFARNDHDLYLAQGYLTARDRLWQMDFVAHVAAGRLAEIVGPERLETDRFFRRMGLEFGARKSTEAALADPVSGAVVRAYSDGINAYISTLTPATYPFEYKLLDYAPERWEPLKSSLILKYMAFDLTGRSDDLRMSNALRKYGPAVMRDLFPDYPTRESPVVPAGTPLDFKPLAVPAIPPAFEAAEAPYTPNQEPGRELGSNNFAVSGARSATGFPLLANDPHLQLNLPSIWYQVQLAAPGVNVYGVSIPGTPTAIIGFNEQAAWGVTNTYADVLDWYQVQFRDASRREYLYNGQWRPVRRVVEHIKIRGQADRLDTVLYTHHGPVVYERPQKPFLPQTPIGYAARWTAHDAANEFLTFYRLNRARTYADYTAALATYGAPAQNFVFADATQDIALWPNGHFPLKWREQGKYLLDGRDPAQEWQGWIPAAQNPHVKNPARGFVSSANQSSVRPEDYPYYLNWDYGSSERGRRINQRLGQMTRATADSLHLLQNDNFGLNAQLMLPRMLALAGTLPATSPEGKALAALRGWDYQYAAGAVGPTVFELWYDNLVKRLWDDDFPTYPKGPAYRYPARDRTNNLILREDTSRWVDDRRTAAKETLPLLARQSLSWAVDSLTRKFGAQSDKWRWASQKSTDILHLLQLPGFGVMDVDCGGGAGIVNATTNRTGPSWRMVVALGPQVRAYGVYPGGQSGNPGSPFYNNLLETWRVGQLDELVFLRTAQEPNARVATAWTLRGK